MKPTGEHACRLDVVPERDLELVDNVVFRLLRDGEPYCEVDKKEVQEGSLFYCKDAYKEQFDSECYIRKTDKRTIKQCAYEDAKSRGRGIVVVSRHVSEKGTRRYYVSSWPHFVKTIYPSIKGKGKSFYENIYLEDPCRLYIDIDLDISDVVPAGSSPESIAIFDKYTKVLHAHVVKMVLATKRLLEALYPGVRVTDVFFIDSSSHATKKRKFSHHLIFHLDGDATFFQNSGDLLRLFNYIEKTSFLSGSRGVDQTDNPFFWPSDIKESFKTDRDAKIEEEEGKAVSPLPAGRSVKDRKFIVDISVFGNSSREFRIVGSTKYGENRHFALIKHQHFENPDFPLRSVDFKNPCGDFNTFGRLLVCFVCENSPIKNVLTFDFANKLALNSIMASINSKDSNGNAINNAATGSSANSASSTYATRRVNHERVIEDDFCTTADMKENYDKLPSHLKKLFGEYSDEKRREFVFEVIASDIMRQNPQLSGETIDWTRYVTRDGSFAVSFRTSSKYCEIKGDEHNNNHVFYVVWLRSKNYYQRCWNEECCQLRQQQQQNAIPQHAQSMNDIKNGENEDEDEASHDGDAENEGKRGEAASEGVSKMYEDNKNVRTCKSQTRLLSSDTWEIIQSFLRVQMETIDVYKRYRAGEFEESMRVESMCNYEVLDDIDLSQEDDDEDSHGAKIEVKYECTDRFKTDPILNDLFPDNK